MRDGGDMMNAALRIIRRVGAANVLATVAAIVAVSGGAWASGIPANLVNSATVRNGSVLKIDLSPRAQRVLRGTTGATGPTGAQGANGPAGTAGAGFTAPTYQESSDRTITAGATLDASDTCDSGRSPIAGGVKKLVSRPDGDLDTVILNGSVPHYGTRTWRIQLTNTDAIDHSFRIWIKCAAEATP